MKIDYKRDKLQAGKHAKNISTLGTRSGTIVKEDNDHRLGREETHLRFAGDRIVKTSVDCLLQKKERQSS